MTVSKFNPNRLITTSYDGTVRCLDLNESKFDLILGDEDDEYYTTYHRELDRSTFLVTLGNSGRLGIVDTRESNRKYSRFHDLYQKAAMKTVDIHPLKTDQFVIATNKGICDVFDLRSGAKSGLQKPLFELQGHTKSVTSAFYSPVNGAAIATVCSDDKIRLFKSFGEKKEIDAYKAIRHNNQTGRWLTTFKAEWHPKRDDLLFCGSMTQPRQIDVFSDQGVQYNSLKGDALGSVTSIVKCHPTLDVVVGGNSSGRVHCFI